MQHVTEPSRARGHTLDLVITDVLSLRVGGLISDHALISFVLPLKQPSVRASTAAMPLCDVPRRVTSSLADFTAVTVDEVAKLTSSAPNKTCQLDTAPTWLVRDLSGQLSPFIALLINKSLTTDCFPGEFKEAIVRPLLKRDGLDLTDLKNYTGQFPRRRCKLGIKFITNHNSYKISVISPPQKNSTTLFMRPKD